MIQQYLGDIPLVYNRDKTVIQHVHLHPGCTMLLSQLAQVTVIMPCMSVETRSHCIKRQWTVCIEDTKATGGGVSHELQYTSCCISMRTLSIGDIQRPQWIKVLGLSIIGQLTIPYWRMHFYQATCSGELNNAGLTLKSISTVMCAWKALRWVARLHDPNIPNYQRPTSKSELIGGAKW